MHLVRYYLEHHGINVLLQSQWIEQGGGLATKQAYYDGIHQIDDDEALIVEFPVPSECHYWQILVADDRFATVDWVNRQSSLNDAQAHVDDDGWFRAVVSKRDPGVYNWLDKADFPWGILQARFYRGQRVPRGDGHQGRGRGRARPPAEPTRARSHPRSAPSSCARGERRAAANASGESTRGFRPAG